MKYLDLLGLQKLWTKIKNFVHPYVKEVSQDGNKLTFTKGNGETTDITIEGGDAYGLSSYSVLTSPSTTYMSAIKDAIQAGGGDITKLNYVATTTLLLIKFIYTGNKYYVYCVDLLNLKSYKYSIDINTTTIQAFLDMASVAIGGGSADTSNCVKAVNCSTDTSTRVAPIVDGMTTQGIDYGQLFLLNLMGYKTGSYLCTIKSYGGDTVNVHLLDLATLKQYEQTGNSHALTITDVLSSEVTDSSDSSAKEVVKVDVMELLTTQNVDLFKALTTLYRNGDIILVASMGGTSVVVSYVDYVSDTHIGWGVSLPIPTYSDAAITKVVTTTFLILYKDGVLTYLTKESSDNSSSGDTSIIDLGMQDSHKNAQQAMVDYLMESNPTSGCYLFKYYCDCYGNACLAIVKWWRNVDFGVDGDFSSVSGTVYDNYRGFREFQYDTDEGFILDGCWVTLASFDEDIESLPTEAKNVIDAIHELNSKIGSGGGATLSIPRIRFANWRYDEDVIYSEEESDFIAGKIVFSVNVQDGTVQEGDELQLCAMRKTFGKTKLRPILSRIITAEDIENLAKQPYLQISTDDCADNTLGGRVFNSLSKTDSSDPSARKPKYIRIRRPVWEENRDGEVVVVNASFSNVVPIQFGLKYEHIE